MLTIEPAEAQSQVTDVRRLEDGVHAAEEDSEALYGLPAGGEEFTAEHVSLTAGPEQAKAECTTLAARIR